LEPRNCALSLESSVCRDTTSAVAGICGVGSILEIRDEILYRTIIVFGAPENTSSLQNSDVKCETESRFESAELVSQGDDRLGLLVELLVGH